MTTKEHEPHDPPFDNSFSPLEETTSVEPQSPHDILARVQEIEIPMADPKDELLLDKPVGINPKDAVASKKPDITLVPPAGILHEAIAMMDGAAKYGPYNWRDNPVLARVYIAAAMRHLQQLLDGEDFDPVSGVHHAGHARACMGIYLDAFETGNLVDDRPKAGRAGAMVRHFEQKQTLEGRF